MDHPWVIKRCANGDKIYQMKVGVIPRKSSKQPLQIKELDYHACNIELCSRESQLAAQILPQPYKCNKKWVIALNPLPHCGSGSLIAGDPTCYTCKRRLNDPGQFRFCCIACQVEVVCRKNEISLGTIEMKHKRKRKGIPHRAPFK
ncbi:hypothetical protein FXO38_05562 [Capsicum annuum]|nr:hypothetical protein FXO37_34284 [Capsicum annuum]KAF3673635.1 hypothetical protein FXO38_05562 [Capsicum annuum]